MLALDLGDKRILALELLDPRNKTVSCHGAAGVQLLPPYTQEANNIT